MKLQNGRKPEVVLVQPTVLQAPVTPLPKPEVRVERKKFELDTEIHELVPLESEQIGTTGMFMAQNALLECLDYGDETSVCIEHLEKPVFIAPVEVGTNTGGVEGLGIFNLPILQHLSKSQTPPRFSNKKEDWMSFL